MTSNTLRVTDVIFLACLETLFHWGFCSEIRANFQGSRVDAGAPRLLQPGLPAGLLLRCVLVLLCWGHKQTPACLRCRLLAPWGSTHPLCATGPLPPRDCPPVTATRGRAQCSASGCFCPGFFTPASSISAVLSGVSPSRRGVPAHSDPCAARPGLLALCLLCTLGPARPDVGCTALCSWASSPEGACDGRPAPGGAGRVCSQGRPSPGCRLCVQRPQHLGHREVSPGRTGGLCVVGFHPSCLRVENPELVASTEQLDGEGSPGWKKGPPGGWAMRHPSAHPGEAGLQPPSRPPAPRSQHSWVHFPGTKQLTGEVGAQGRGQCPAGLGTIRQWLCLRFS